VRWLTRGHDVRFLLVVILLGIGLRLIHLIDTSHYHILGADSYYFHYLAKQALVGESTRLTGSGLVHPLAWLADVSSLYIASCVVPVFVYIVGCVGVWFGVGRLYSRSVAVGAVVSYTIIPLSILITAAGYLDRDGGTVVLMVALVLGWYSLRSRTILSFFWALIIIEVISIYWSPVTRWVPIAMVSALAITYYAAHKERYKIDSFVGLSLMACVVSAAIGVIVDGLGTTSTVGSTAIEGISGDTHIVELSHATPAHLLVMYSYALVTGIVGGIMMARRRAPEDLMVLVWLAGTLIIGMVIQRVLILAIPAGVIVSGIGLVVIYQETRKMLQDLRARTVYVAVAGVIGLVLAFTGWQAYHLSSVDRMAPNSDWQDALRYLRENTNPDAKVLSHWGYGYWIQDLADRKPAAAGGPRYESEMETICSATKCHNVKDVMENLQTDYLILDTRHVDGDYVCSGIWFGDVVITLRRPPPADPPGAAHIHE